MKVYFSGNLDEFREVFGGCLVIEHGEEEEEEGKEESNVLSLVTPSPGAVEPATPLTAREKMLAELPKISEGQRKAAWAMFVDTCAQWVQGFADPNVLQPDRLELLRDLGTGAWPVPVLVMAYEIGSLQALVANALVECLYEATWSQKQLATGASTELTAWLDHVNQVAGNMVQVSHMAFADLDGTFDHTSAWRKTVTERSNQ